MRTECLKHFTEQFAYPAEARDSLLRDYAAVCGDEAENARLEADQVDRRRGRRQPVCGRSAAVYLPVGAFARTVQAAGRRGRNLA